MHVLIEPLHLLLDVLADSSQESRLVAALALSCHLLECLHLSELAFRWLRRARGQVSRLFGRLLNDGGFNSV
jgi:hypothetical protein